MEWPAQSPDLNPIELLWEQLDRMVRNKCPSSQSNLWEVLQEAWGEISSDYLNKLTARMPKVCKAVIAENGELFDESKVWRTKLLFQIKIIIFNLINVLIIFSIHFATCLINKSVSFHGKHEIVWVTPNFWTVVYLQKSLENNKDQVCMNTRGNYKQLMILTQLVGEQRRHRLDSSDTDTCRQGRQWNSRMRKH